jgi:hypothetical protein
METDTLAPSMTIELDLGVGKYFLLIVDML